ncbi:FlxA-like family protein [Paenibacillus sp. L3-i20]|uniref:FlxA-like family protein n=1 Tax=Paenibacillus sp. L3-i20 TaxID=2905833 RepID=UPI001EDF132A|nr:FlxA-like family protein [Paenibacillus sp. L3-i20]GKU77328.1 hypothetical protein L3i20_v217250 [Paenibacillus sp. L3-i20]
MSYMSSVSNSARGSKGMTSYSVQDKKIQQLNKELARMQEELGNVNNNQDLDPKLKMERVKALTSSIQEIESRISESKMEDVKKKVSESQSTDSRPSRSKSEHDPDLAIIVEKSASLSQLNKMAGQRTKTEGEIKTLEGGVRLDRTNLESGSSNDSGRSEMLQNAENTVFKLKREMVQEKQDQLKVTDQKMSELVSSINEPVEGGDKPANIEETAPTNAENVGNPSGTKEQKVKDRASTTIDIRV